MSADRIEKVVLLNERFYLLGEHDTSDRQGYVKAPYDLRSEWESTGVRFVPLT